MKVFVIILCLFAGLYSSEIDTKLYDENNNTAYYETISKIIDEEKPENESDVERLATEKFLLKKLVALQSTSLSIEKLPNFKIDKKEKISVDSYMNFLNALVNHYTKIDVLKKEQSEIKSKRQYLKQTISNLTKDNIKNLRLYQLQYAYYKIQQGNNEKVLKEYEVIFEEGKLNFTEKLKRVRFDKVSISDRLKTINEEISNLEKNFLALNLAKERELLSGDTITKKLEQKISTNTTKLNTLIIKKVDKILLIAFSHLQEKEAQESLDVLNFDDISFETLSTVEQQKLEYKQSIVKDIAKNVVGNVAVALSSVEDSVEELYSYVYTKFTEDIFVFNEQGISVFDIIKLLSIIILGFLVAGFYKRKIMYIAVKREKLSLTSAKVVSSIGYYLIVFITLLIALKSIGLDLSSFGMIAGALSIGIGFGLQNIVSNIAAGIILMFEKTIRLGDYVEISDTTRGTVSNMRMRSTTITTNDNIDVIIPNSSFIQNNVVNWTLENDVRRIRVPFSVAYGTKNDRVEEVIKEELKNSGLEYVRDSQEHPVSIWMVAMGSSSVDYELVLWIRGIETKKPTGTKSQYLKFIYAALNEHHIEIPFPQLDVHMK